MKAKLIALILAAGLGITAIATTAQAEGRDSKDTCQHETLVLFDDFVSASYYDGLNHLSTYITGYECSEDSCFYTTMVETYYKVERHDYEQTYFHDGSVMSICLDCHDTYYW